MYVPTCLLHVQVCMRHKPCYTGDHATWDDLQMHVFDVFVRWCSNYWLLFSLHAGTPRSCSALLRALGELAMLSRSHITCVRCAGQSRQHEGLLLCLGRANAASFFLEWHVAYLRSEHHLIWLSFVVVLCIRWGLLYASLIVTSRAVSGRDGSCGGKDAGC